LLVSLNKETNNRSNSSDSAESDGESNVDTANFEKKLYLIMIPHILFWKN